MSTRSRSEGMFAASKTGPRGMGLDRRFCYFPPAAASNAGVDAMTLKLSVAAGAAFFISKAVTAAGKSLPTRKKRIFREFKS